MSQNKIYDSQPSFAGGLNTTSDPAELGPDQARLLTNYRLNDIGGATKRGGTKITGTLTGAVTGAITYGTCWINATTPDTIVVTDGLGATNWNKAVYTSGTMGSWSAFTFCTPPTLFTMAACINASGAEILVCPRSGSNGIATIDGSFTTVNNYAAGSIPLTGVCVYNRRLWAWGNNPTTGSNLYFSDYDNPSSLNDGAAGGGVIKVRTFSSDGILACAPLASSLLIFHSTAGISRLSGYGQSDITAVPQGVASDVALIGPRALTTYQGICYFMTRRGLCIANEGAVSETATTEKPDPVVPILAADPTNAFSTVVLYNRQLREVWVLVPSNGLWVYNTLVKSWSGPFNGPFTQANAQAHVFEIRDTGRKNAPLVLMSSATAATVVECDYATAHLDGIAANGTGGSAFQTVLQCHRMFGGEGQFMYAKSWRWANILADLDLVGTTASVTIGGTSSLVVSSRGAYVVADTGIYWGISDTQTLTSSGNGQTVYYINASGVSPYIDVTITDAGNTASTISRVDVWGFLLGQR